MPQFTSLELPGRFTLYELAHRFIEEPTGDLTPIQVSWWGGEKAPPRQIILENQAFIVAFDFSDEQTFKAARSIAIAVKKVKSKNCAMNLIGLQRRHCRLQVSLDDTTILANKLAVSIFSIQPQAEHKSIEAFLDLIRQCREERNSSKFPRHENRVSRMIRMIWANLFGILS